MMLFGALAVALIVTGGLIVNRAKTPPWAYLGLTCMGAGIPLGLIAGAIALFRALT